MIKVVTPLKRRSDLSREEFRNYYESHHRLLGEKYLAGYANRYLRRYLEAFKKMYPDIKIGKGCINFCDKDAIPLYDLATVARSAMEFRH